MSLFDSSQKDIVADSKHRIYVFIYVMSYPVITTLVRKKCENIIPPPFQFDHLPNQVSKSLYSLKVSESEIIFAHLFRGLSLTDLFVSKLDGVGPVDNRPSTD